MTVVLQTGRLLLRRVPEGGAGGPLLLGGGPELRRFTEGDAEALLLLESDPEVLRHVGREPLADAEAYRRHVRSAFLPCYGRPGGRPRRLGRPRQGRRAVHRRVLAEARPGRPLR